MKKFALVFMFAGLLMSCDNDDDVDVIDDNDDGFEGRTEEYAINPYGDFEVEGMITFTENEDGSITADIELDNTVEGEMHPAQLHAGNGAEDGETVLTFEDVDGDDGTSSTTFDQWDDESDVSWEELMGFDGHINVYLSAEDDSVVAQGDTGDNVLTGESVTYDLDELNESGISGTATFEERENGETLVIIMLDETPEDGEHPAHILTGAVEDEEEGTVAISLNPVDGTTGMSRTNISHYDDTDDGDGEEVSYEELLAYEGYINVYQSDEDDTIVSQGNVGASVVE